MIAVTDDFVEKVELANKRPKVKVEIDWDMDANYENETSYAMSVGVERRLNEPLGGIAIAQADVVFANRNNRYTT
jgi:hypothetical protein